MKQGVLAVSLIYMVLALPLLARPADPVPADKPKTIDLATPELVLEACSLIAKGKYQEAIAKCTEVINKDPKDAPAYNARAHAYSALGKKQRAIKDFTKAIELDPQSPYYYFGRGDEYLSQRNHQRAIEDYTKGLNITPESFLDAIIVGPAMRASAYSSRGQAYAALGKKQQAIDYYNKAIQLNPNNSQLYLLLGNAYGDLGNERQAIEHYKIGARLDDKDSQILLERLSRNSNTLKLACSISVPQRSKGTIETVELFFNVDVVSGTVNGYQANITQDTISFTEQHADGKIKVLINRYTGTCTAAMYNVPNVPDGSSVSGTCRNVTERQF